MSLRVVVVDHPLVADSLRLIRDRSTPNALFRQNLERLGTLLLTEATRTLPILECTVETPLATAPAHRLAIQPVIVPVLRAGLGFVRPAQELLPDADIGFVGIARDEATFQPHPYVNRLPDRLDGRPVIVVDPMLATGGSLAHTLELLVERGPLTPLRVVCAVSAPEGIARIERSGIDVEIYTAVVDERLNDQAFIVPGLGDAGDRQFGTAPH